MDKTVAARPVVKALYFFENIKDESVMMNRGTQ